MTRLPKWESNLNYILWCGFFTYTLYNVHKDGNLLKRDVMDSRDFSPGFFSWMEKDDSDTEWTLATTWIFNLFPYVSAHLILAEIIRFYDPEAVPFFYFLFTICFLVLHFPPLLIAIFIIHYCLFFLVAIFGNKKVVWTLALFSLMLVNLDFAPTHVFRAQDSIWFYFVMYSWLIIKSTDFALVEMKSKQNLSKKFSTSLGFCFYLPNFFLGPVIPYEAFKNNIYRTYQPWGFQRFLPIIKDILRVFLAYVIFELFSHFFYCNAMHFYPTQVLKLGYLTSDGIGLCMSQLFYLKYVFMYGFAITFAKAELYNAPPTPKCVFRIYLYSDMWRYFDRGFYLFMYNSIYKPVCGSKRSRGTRRLFASFLCFTFVFIWHGMNKTVLIWSILNFLGVAIEALGRMIGNTRSFKKIEARLDPRMFRRLKALVCSPLLIMAIASNFVFFGGFTLGKSYLQQLFNGDFSLLLHLIIIGYLMCQASMEFPLNEKPKSKNV